MKGVIIYNYSLKNESYLKNVQLFEKETNLKAIANNSIDLLINSDEKKFNFDYCIFLDKDICLAKALENSGVRVYNSSHAIAVCDNKAYTHLSLSGKIKMPCTFIPPFSYTNSTYTSPLPYPVVIKECYGSLGEQVYLAENQEQFEAIIKKIGTKQCIMQEYIETNGTDYRLYTVNGKVVAAIKRENDKDFRANCELGGVASLYTPENEMVELAEKASELLKLDFGGIDIIKRRDQYYFIEANSSAMVSNIMNKTKVNIPKLLMEHINKTRT